MIVDDDVKGAMIDDGVMLHNGWSNDGNGAMMIEDR